MRSTKPLPFGFNPKVEHRNSRLRRLIRKHSIKPLTKAQARAICKEAFEQANAGQGCKLDDITATGTTTIPVGAVLMIKPDADG